MVSIQLCARSMAIWWLWDYVAAAAGYALVMFAVVDMLRHRRSPAVTCAWLLTFVFVPVIGVVLYFLFGGVRIRREQRRKARTGFAAFAEPGMKSPSVPVSPLVRSLTQLLANHNIPPARPGNQLRLCDSATEVYEQLGQLVDGASQRLWLVTFIFADDPVAAEFRDRIAQRAAAGVDVRILIDGVGSFKTARRFFDPVRQAGGKVARFKPLFTLPLKRTINLRNHRKMLVVDSRFAFVGGLNICDEEISPAPSVDSWRDLGAVVEGPLVHDLEAVFVSDWRATVGSSDGLDPPRGLPPAAPDDSEGAYLQIVPAGPDVRGEALYNYIVSVLHQARSRIWVATPYFVPNESIQEALLVAIRRGVDVRLMVPERSNHPISDLAASSFLRELHDAGGKVLRYPRGMMHAKAFVVDDDVAALGSANLDMRSLFLNYELMLIAYSNQDIKRIESWFANLAKECHTKLPPRTLVRDLGEGLIRIASPLF